MSHPKPLSRRAVRGVLALLSAIPVFAQACSIEPYIGETCVRASDWCPRGYVPADGRLLSIREYTALFGLVGFTYGGDKQNTFGIPDLRGRMVVGSGMSPGNQNVALNQQVGQQQITLTPAQRPLPAHGHDVAVSILTAQTPITLPATTGTASIAAALPVVAVAGTGTAPAGNAYLTSVGGTVSNVAATFQGPYTGTVPSGTTQATLPAIAKVDGVAGTPLLTSTTDVVTGGNVTVSFASATTPTPAPISTQSPGLGMNVCIAVEGYYPNRP